MKCLWLVPDTLDKPFGGMGILYKNLFNHLKHEIQIDLMHNHSFSSLLLSGLPNNITTSLLLQTEIFKNAIESFERPDIVHANDWSTAWAGLLLSKYWNCKLIYHCHLNLSKGFSPNAKDRSAIQTIQTIEDMELVVLNNADCIIHVSKAYAKLYPPMFPFKTRILYNSIDLQQWRNYKSFNLPGNNTIKCLYIGRYAQMKNVQSILAAKIPDNIDIIFAGGNAGGDRDIFNNLMHYINNTSNAYYIGPVYDQEKIDLMHAVNFVIMPSTHEPFGIVALEALASKSILISSFQDGLGEICDESFAINCGTTPETISQALKVASEMSIEEMNKRIEVGSKHIQNWDIKKQCDKLINIYKEII